ncbi:hypothetical protein BU24DRAFT_46343 [Aaosphaeria arxii CBS 175.79]|uniref:Phosphatidylglycerol lysyltransferase C-terminal domain-containing protein n=1 Tax=Aaosphaeria arxii CBS 175.79 TaxID=1450172 RepID=A0A6A5XCV2_9PLEO|nr:uncharacterized protein BU24DRAFT_46343 [Aaosphaeria arxii CBS 175.79]KAF2010808.1 hypothetical protein BU24DRAFT_46343 [Aaosphaeria arxii CBS 175.79]
MDAAAKMKQHKTLTSVKSPGNNSVSNARRDFFDDLGSQLKAMLKATHIQRNVSSPVPVQSHSSLKSMGMSEVNFATIVLGIATQQIMSYALPRTTQMDEKEPRNALPTYTTSIPPPPYCLRPSPEVPSSRASLESLLSRYSQVAHMVLTDASYAVFITREVPGAICYKVHNDLAVICGDPLCEPYLFDSVLREFQLETGRSTRQMAFLGMSETFKQFAIDKQWVSINFGIERTLNPVTNPILSGACSKRIYAQARQLLDPQRGGLELAMYDPAHEQNDQLESAIMDIYNQWHLSREDSSKVQSYLTLFDFRSYPGEIFYIYIKDKDGRIHGFGGLRKLGKNQGYHLDPCVEAVDAQRGTADLIVVASMSLLKTLGIGCLSLGYEPVADINNMTGTSKLTSQVLGTLYQRLNDSLQLEGKRKHNDRFKPDDAQNANLYLVFPTKRLPRLQQLLAVLATVHLDIQNSRGIASALGFRFP